MKFNFTKDGFIVNQMQAISCLNLPAKSNDNSKEFFPLVKELEKALKGKLVPRKNEITFDYDKRVTWGYAAKNSGFNASAVLSKPNVYMQIKKKEKGYSVYAVGKDGIEKLLKDMNDENQKTSAQLDSIIDKDFLNLIRYTFIPDGETNILNLTLMIKELAKEDLNDSY
ncbi:MAG: hypothetical protein GYA02_11305 [Clostridiaceae bacterium]|nr:hypothetical protein [Clostridiaceae bacterium]